MLTKRDYIDTKFPPKILHKALDELKSVLGEDQVKADHRIMVSRDERRYERGDEATFFKYYQSDFKWASYKSIFHSGYLQVYAKWDRSPPVSEVYVRLPNSNGHSYLSYQPFRCQDIRRLGRQRC